jgi:hypothetical protein
LQKISPWATFEIMFPESIQLDKFIEEFFIC